VAHVRSRALLARGIATLSIDLPLHGAREGSIDDISLRNPLQLIGAWRLALREVSLSLDYLTQLAVIDARRLALVGYSLGSFLSVAAAVDFCCGSAAWTVPQISDITS